MPPRSFTPAAHATIASRLAAGVRTPMRIALSVRPGSGLVPRRSRKATRTFASSGVGGERGISCVWGMGRRWRTQGVAEFVDFFFGAGEEGPGRAAVEAFFPRGEFLRGVGFGVDADGDEAGVAFAEEGLGFREGAAHGLADGAAAGEDEVDGDGFVFGDVGVEVDGAAGFVGEGDVGGRGGGDEEERGGKSEREVS